MNKIEIMKPISEISVAHKIGNSQESTPLHVHNQYEIFISRSNNYRFFVGNEIYDVGKNDVFMFNNTDVHKISAAESADVYERFVVMFSPRVFDDASPEIKRILQYFDSRNTARRIKTTLTDEQVEDLVLIARKMIDCNEDVRNKNLKLWLYLIQLLLVIIEVPNNQFGIQSETEDKRINEILQYIRINSEFPITLDILSQKFYLNKHYLCRVFKKKTGFNISHYVEACRLSNAISLLREGLPVSVVALRAGFGSDTYFISTFKKNLGFSPKQYIKNYSLIKPKKES